MMCDSYLNGSASLGSPGLSEVKWLRPVYAGETLSGTMTVLSRRLSSKRPEMGIVECRWELASGAGEKKLAQQGIHFIGVARP